MTPQSSRKSPIVSVLMTIYNAGPYLKEAIDSIVAQTFRDWELIAIENGSSDASPDILKSYSDPRIRVFMLPDNIGRTPALRHAFDQVQGEYIAVLDADDVSHPERFTRQTDFLDKHPETGLVGSWAECIDGRSNVTSLFDPPVERNELLDSLGWMNPFVHSSIMYRTSLAQEIGGYPEAYKYAQDKALILNLSTVSRVAMIDEYLCKVRSVPTSMSMSSKYRITIASEELELLYRAVKDIPLSNESLKLNMNRQSVSQLKIGVALICDWHIICGLVCLFKGIIVDPSGIWRNGVVARYWRSR